MKLQQLRYAVETWRCNLNVSEAAERLFTSQPGVSKQIRLLEDELGVQIFIRNGKRMVAVTPVGKAVLETAEQILHDVQKIKQIKHQFLDSNQGQLRIAISPNLARFRLPESLARLMQQHPNVNVHIQPCAPDVLGNLVQRGEVDMGITCHPTTHGEWRRLVCERWDYALLLPQHHALNELPEINLHDILNYPLLTSADMMLANSSLRRALVRSGVADYRVALSSNELEVLQTYVRLGLGVAVVDAAARDGLPNDLVLREFSGCLMSDDVQILLRPDSLLRQYHYDFFEYFHADLQRERVEQLLYAPLIDDFSI